MNFFKNFFSNRRNVLVLCVILTSSIMVGRLFTLQIVRGEDYQNNYRLKVERQSVIDATRGNIYDRNGELLAYNKLANAVTIEDIGNYDSEEERNNTINSQLKEIIEAIENNGDKLYMDFGIYMDSGENYVFREEGTRLNRFRADIFGRADIAELKYNDKAKVNEATASADEIMEYLCGYRYDIPKEYPKHIRFKIASIRYRMSLNTYQKYISTTIANQVSEKTVAFIMENKYRYTGINVEEQSVRVYEDAECFANILGYTGKISTEEYEELSKEDDSYTLNDIIGKSGLEQYMNKELMGEKGYQTVYVDSLGNLLETAEIKNQKSGNDIYLSIDKELTIKTYKLLEQEIAGILYSKIANIKEYDSNATGSRDDIIIPIYDVYFALVENRVIDINKNDRLTDNEKRVFDIFDKKFNEVIESFGSRLSAQNGTEYNLLPKEYQNYSTYLIKKLKADGIFDTALIDNEDETQKLWMSEQLSVNEYLKYVIDKGWIKIETFVKDNEYIDAEQVYGELIDYCINMLQNDGAFKRQVYYYAILEDRINAGELCAILYDQGVLEKDDETRNALINGSMDTYSFMKEKIKNLDITPGQLGLDPCSGSCVLMDPDTGELLALVSYPGYDSNRLANNLDNDYYAYLNANKASPLFNHATQEKTAPGSTFKMVSSVAGIGEGAIDISTIIEDQGKFMEVSNQPQCWIYPSNHGSINVAEAIRDSCNYFFYEVGWRLAGGNINLYNDERGIKKIAEYANLFGFGEKTGVEVEEATSDVATEYPVMAAIGQSNHNFTTVSLARYVSAVANLGDVYDLTLLSKVVDKDGNTVETFGPKKKNSMDTVDISTWNTIKSGMRMVVDNMDIFEGFPIELAGKTGTAQQSNSRPNHALFVGFAPYNAPEIAIACRISYGYTSHNAADFAKRLLAEYFDVGDYDVNAGASNVNDNNNAFAD